MTDELERLQKAMRAAIPAPEPEARRRAIEIAQKNFAARQGSADQARQRNDRPEERGGFLDGVFSMLNHIGLRPALYATSSLAVIGLGLVLVMPNGRLSHDLGPSVTTPPAATGQPAGSVPKTMPGTARTEAVTRRKKETQTLAGGVAGKPAPAPAMEAAVDKRAYMVSPEVAEIDPYDAGTDNRDRFANADPNPVHVTAEDPVSTFSVDVDTAAYSYIRSSIMNGYLPLSDAVRIEEMINYFPYDYVAPTGDLPFSTAVSVFQTPWNPGTRLVHIGIQGRMPAVEDRPPLDLVFLVDTSGSMRDADKLPLLKQAFALMLSELRAGDRVSIVTYAGNSGVVLEATEAGDRAAIMAALERLEAGGRTAGAEGLQLAYAQAEKMHQKGRLGRVILATDGDFNVGLSDPGALKDYIAHKRQSGTYLSVLGFGRGNLNDELMQALAQNGNGTAAYIDTLNEAQKVMVDQVAGALFPIANDVKIQVEFNPAMVAEYRLIGYETRTLRREDFNNDKVDAGDIGAGHTVTAIYEVTPVGSDAVLNDPLRYGGTAAPGDGGSGELGFVKLRYKAPGETKSHLIETPITEGAGATGDARFAAAIAGFGQILGGGSYLGDWSYADAIELANANRGEDPFGYRAEAVRLMRLAQSLSK